MRRESLNNELMKKGAINSYSEVNEGKQPFPDRGAVERR
jgi:hypothetical protein